MDRFKGTAGMRAWKGSVHSVHGIAVRKHTGNIVGLTVCVYQTFIVELDSASRPAALDLGIHDSN